METRDDKNIPYRVSMLEDTVLELKNHTRAVEDAVLEMKTQREAERTGTGVPLRIVFLIIGAIVTAFTSAGFFVLNYLVGK